jgi:hypothetical protein
MDKPKMLNFRCPDDLWADIDKLGTVRHSKGDGTFHLTATLLEILKVGLASINDNPDILTDGNTVSKTTIEAMVKEAIATLESKTQAELAELRGEVEEVKKPLMAI